MKPKPKKKIVPKPKPKAKAKPKRKPRKKKVTLKGGTETTLPVGVEESPWAVAALPGGAHPDTSAQLKVLLKGIGGSCRLADKDDMIVVPTTSPGLNRSLHISGFPTECVVLLHGPSKGGKTVVALMLCASFQMQGHFAVYVDAEHTLDKKLAMACDVNNALLEYWRPKTYEETTKKVEQLINNFEAARKAKKILPHQCMVIVVDSITKLVPESELAELSKTGKGYPIRALMNTNWLDKLTPMIGSLPIVFVMIAHEKVKIDAQSFEKKWRVKGGEALIYDSTVAMRSQVEKALKIEKKKKKIVVGQLHKVVVEKSKVGISHEQWKFAMSNGREGVPIGIDHTRGVMEEAKLRGEGYLTRKTGGLWVCEQFPEGEIKFDSKVLSWFRSNPQALNEVIARMNIEAADAVVESHEAGDEEDE